MSAVVAAENSSSEAEEASERKATVNPCTLCAPLGAALASAGLAGAVPLLHGGQGCATYIRRYLISHFREPMDIASSSFGESETVFGGEHNLMRALDNIVRQYDPAVITVATTCVAETIGEDVAGILGQYASTDRPSLPIVHVRTPSYAGGHNEGFHAMVHAIVERLATERGDRLPRVNILPPPLSPADLRHVSELVSGFGVHATVLPNYSQTLDGAVLARYQAIPPGGTPLSDVALMPRALSTVDLTMVGRAPRASTLLAQRGSPAKLLGLPIGVRATDALMDHLRVATESSGPAGQDAERGRLLDAYADGHKYVFGKRVGVYGDPELVAALARFLIEIGARPVVCATGARNRALSTAIADLPRRCADEVLEDTDFSEIEAACRRTRPDLLLGSSKGYRIARALKIPLVRVGFPVHDRFGASRTLVVGYRGTLALFDSIVNALIAERQDSSNVGFSYL